MVDLKRAFARWRPLVEAHGAGALLAIATIAFVVPVWIGAIPPLTDFGGHLAMADAWARYEEVPLFREEYELRTEIFAPNFLPSRLARTLYPAFDPDASLRLFASFALVATVWSLVFFARTFGRSTWLVFLGLPFLWNGMFALGLLSYVASFPLFFAGLAVAHRAGAHGRPRDAAWLGAVSLASFFTHGIGFVFVVFFSGCALLFSVRRAKSLLLGAAMLPAVLLWGVWVKSAGAVGQNVRQGSLLDVSSWRSAEENLAWLLQQAHQITASQEDTWILLATLALWLILMTEPGVRPDDVVPEEAVLARHRDRVLLALTLAVGVALLALPSYVRNLGINSRLVPLFVWLLLLLPRVRRPGRVAACALAASVVLSAYASTYVLRSARDFDRREGAVLAGLIAELPRGARVECLGMASQTDKTQVFFRRPLCHACAGLASVEIDGFSGGGFAATDVNAVQFRRGRGYPTLSHVGAWHASARTLAWDYVIVRGAAPAGTMGHVERIAHRPPAEEGAGPYGVYRVRRPPPVTP